MSAKEIAQVIAHELMFEYEPHQRISDDRLEKETYLAVADLKADIKDEVEKILKGHGYTIEE